MLPEATLCGALRRVANELPPCTSAAPALVPTLQGTPTYLTPLASHPAGGRAAAQVAAHGGRRLGCRRTVRGRQCGALVCALTKDHTMAKARPAAGGALQLEGAFHAQWATPARSNRKWEDVGPVGGEEGTANSGPVKGGPLGPAGVGRRLCGTQEGQPGPPPCSAQGVGWRSGGEGRLTSDQSRAAHSGGQAGPWQASSTGGRGCGHALSSSAFSSAADTRRWHTTERLRTPASQLRLQRDQFPTTQLWGEGRPETVSRAGHPDLGALADPPPPQQPASLWKLALGCLLLLLPALRISLLCTHTGNKEVRHPKGRWLPGLD